MLIVFYAVGFVLALCLSVGGYVYAKRALKDLKARALAREQVLTAFSFPELEDFDDLESPTIDRLPSSRLLPKKQGIEMVIAGQNGKHMGLSSEPQSEEQISRSSSGDELLALKKTGLETRSSKAGSDIAKGGTRKADETRLVADCSIGLSSDEE